MPFVVAAAIKDLRRRLADPAALLIWIGIPLAIGGLMNLVIGSGGSAPPRARVLVVDQDETFVSRLLAGTGGAGGVGGFIDLEPVTLDDGQRRIDAGEASALLIIPEGFQRAVLEETPAELRLITNPSQRILPGIVREALEMLLDGVFYFQRIFGPELRSISGQASGSGGPVDADVAAVAVAINTRLRELEGVVLPPVMSLEVKVEATRSGTDLNFGQLFFPGILFMSILFIAQGMSVDIWQEKSRGTLRRTLTTPQSSATWLGGKLLAGTALIAVVVLVSLVASTMLFDVAWTRVPVAFVWCVFTGAVLLALMTLLQVFATSQRGAQLLSTLVVFPLIMIGGSFFPFEAMPTWMAAIGRWTPNGLALVRLKEILFGEPSAGPLLFAAAGIALAGLLAILVADRRIRGRFATG